MDDSGKGRGSRVIGKGTVVGDELGMRLIKGKERGKLLHGGKGFGGRRRDGMRKGASGSMLGVARKRGAMGQGRGSKEGVHVAMAKREGQGNLVGETLGWGGSSKTKEKENKKIEKYKI